MKLEHRSLFLASLSVLAAAPAAAQGKVWVVDDSGGPGVAFTALQPAVNTAAEGDTLLVKDGTYDESVLISGKSLAVIAEVGASVQILRTVYVESLSASQWSLLRGLDLPMTSTFIFAQGEALRLGGSTGPYWVEDCAVDGDFQPGGAAAGVLVSFAPSAVFARCHLRGGNGIASKAGNSQSGGPGLFAVNTAAFVYESTLLGEVGKQTTPVFGPSAFGGTGATIDTSTLFASGTDLIGGQGVNGATGAFGCFPGGNGGNGIDVYNASSQALLLDSTLQPGAGGLAAGACGAGASGVPSFLIAGTLTTLPGTSHSLSVASPVREGQSVQAVATGTPGELVFLGVATSQAPALLLPHWGGAVHIGAGFSLLAVGAIPASGTLAIAATAGQLAPGLDSAVIYIQPGFVTLATSSIALGAPSALVVLDSSF